MSTSQRKYPWSQRQHLEATVWLLRLQDPNLPLRDWERWLRWYAVPENQAAYDEVESQWLQLDFATLAVPANTADLVAPEDAPEIPAASGRGAMVWKLVAGLAVVTIAVCLMFVSQTEGTTIETAAGTWEQQFLPDGTDVHVGPKSRLNIDFSSKRRSVEIERGEALFTVAKDPEQRPFVVHTHLSDAVAVGTKFGVAIVNASMVVTVAEGVVAVSRAGAVSASQVQVTADKQATVQGNVIVVRAVDADRALQRMTGWCEFDGETVEEAVGEFNRFNEVQIEIQDEALAARPLGYHRFRCDRPDVFASTVQRSSGAVLISEGSTLTLKAGAAGDGAADDN